MRQILFLFLLSFLLFANACSTMTGKLTSKEKKQRKEQKREENRKTLEEELVEYKDDIKACFDLESFTRQVFVTVKVDVQRKGKVSAIRLHERDKKKWKITKSLRECLKKVSKSMAMPEDAERATIELQIRD